MTERFFITGNGTEIGKTVLSAIFVEAFDADYWKPVQAGELEATDSMKVKALVSESSRIFHPESFALTEPMSPHAAAARDGVQISLSDIQLPETERALIIEGAGGVYVPLNDTDTMLDLMIHLQSTVVLVSRQYLGSINHTLLTWEALKNRNIDIAGIVFNGPQNVDSEEIILKTTGLPCLLRVGEEAAVNHEMVSRYAKVLRDEFPTRS